MPSKKKVKVKDLANKYDIPPGLILRELKEEGFELKSASSVVSEDLVELVEEHVKDMAEQKQKSSTMSENKLNS